MPPALSSHFCLPAVTNAIPLCLQSMLRRCRVSEHAHDPNSNSSLTPNSKLSLEQPTPNSSLTLAFSSCCPGSHSSGGTSHSSPLQLSSLHHLPLPERHHLFPVASPHHSRLPGASGISPSQLALSTFSAHPLAVGGSHSRCPTDPVWHLPPVCFHSL